MAATAVVTACVHVRVQATTPAAMRASLCPEAVVLFAAPGDVHKAYVEVAQFSTGPFGADYRPSPEDVQRATRKKAAALGANGLILHHALGGRELRYDDAVAIFVPDDSAAAAAACARG